jgi:hypothetical protein
MSHPPIPESEFTPPWHQYFVKLKDYITGYFTANDTRLDAVEASIGAITDEDEDWPIGCVAFLAPNESRLYTAGEKIELPGESLNAPILWNESTIDGAVYLDDIGPIVGVGTWRLLNPPTATETKAAYRFFNFKRIS